MDQGSKIFDELGRLMNDAASVADGIRREVETVVRSQMERIVADLDLVKRDDFEALKELVRNHSDEIAGLRKELDALKSRKKGR
ncbi:MAG TPA: accessory factor UbiK family protein [Devosiaceae bacterium]|nr:accessory factor UbiK family protein [Devosiaceae bacterium]